MADGRRTGLAARSMAGIALAAVLLATATPARAADPWEQAGHNVDVAFDLVVLRPLNAAALALGAVFFCVSAPFVWYSGGIPTAFDVFVNAPYEYTIVRPLGEF